MVGVVWGIYQVLGTIGRFGSTCVNACTLRRGCGRCVSIQPKNTKYVFEIEFLDSCRCFAVLSVVAYGKSPAPLVVGPTYKYGTVVNAPVGIIDVVNPIAGFNNCRRSIRPPLLSEEYFFLSLRSCRTTIHFISKCPTRTLYDLFVAAAQCISRKENGMCCIEAGITRLQFRRITTHAAVFFVRSQNKRACQRVFFYQYFLSPHSGQEKR